MTHANGRKRVIVTNLAPQVAHGQYPAKVVLDENTIIAADAFCDGHDELRVVALFKHEKERQWKEIPMSFKENDHWEVAVRPDKYGQYLFKVQAWVDHFLTWQKALLKKHMAGQVEGIDLAIGAQLLKDMAIKATKADKLLLQQWVSLLENSSDVEDTVKQITDSKVSEVTFRNTDRLLATTSAETLKLDVERKKAQFSTWYELFPRSASELPGKHGTFNDVKKLLPGIAGLGFDVLYFPPIHPIGKEKRKGKNNALTAGPDDPGSPWAIGNDLGGHKAINPELGTLKDFRDLIAAAKKHGMEIAMDIAFQCAPDHPYVKEHPQWFKWRPDGTVQYAENPPKKYEDILPFNFETAEWTNLWEELKSVIEYWITVGIDIFRIDNPHTKPFLFWEWLIAEVRRAHPQVIFLAEAFTRPRLMEQLAQAGFTQSYTYFTWRNTKSELEQYLTELTKTDQRYYFRPNFWPNTPDILSPELVNGGENAHLIRLILAGTLSSNYGLYGPVYELGINRPFHGKEEYMDSEKYEIQHWDWTRYTKTREIIARINKIRKENTALHTTANIEFAKTTNERIICYCKIDSVTKNALIVAVNLDPFNTQSAEIDLPLAKLGINEGSAFTVKDLLSGDQYQWYGARNYVQLNPYDLPAHILLVNNVIS